MILSNLTRAERYYALHPLFPLLFDYVRTHDLLHAPLGRITIQGDDLFINNVEILHPVSPTDIEHQQLEMHRDYIDVHILLAGQEVIGWRDIATLRTFTQEYRAEGDCALSAEPSEVMIPLQPGEFLAVWPEDAHAPALSQGPIRKLIAKIKVS